LLVWYSPGECVEEKLGFIEAVFTDLLPETTHLAHLKHRMVSQIHMSEVFSAANRNDYRDVSEHLWPGIRSNPTWLLNRGVVAVALRQMFAIARNNADE